MCTMAAREEKNQLCLHLDVFKTNEISILLVFLNNGKNLPAFSKTEECVETLPHIQNKLPASLC